MKRAIIVPPALAPAALDELKLWLAISTGSEDAALAALLKAALELCEAFTGQMPLACECEEVLAATIAWHRVQTRPVQAIEAVEGFPADGARFALAAGDYEVDFDADGGARVRVLRPIAAERITVRFTAGLAESWSALPDGLRHGVLRLAAHAYRQRDGEGQPVPPAAVVALWRPWRRVRLA